MKFIYVYLYTWFVGSREGDRAVRVRGLDGDFGLCSWASHLTQRVRLSDPGEQMGTGKLIVGL